LLSFLDPWLHRKNKKNPKSKSQTGSPDISAADPSFNALAAAGLKVGSLPWSIPTTQKSIPMNGLESQEPSWPALSSPAIGNEIQFLVRLRNFRKPGLP